MSRRIGPGRVRDPVQARITAGALALVALPLGSACSPRSGETSSGPSSAGDRPSTSLESSPLVTGARGAPLVARAPLPPPLLRRETTSEPTGPEFVRVSVHHSLEASLSRDDAELGPALAQVAKRVLVWWMDVRRDLRADDRLELLFERVEDAEPQLDWIAYTSAKHGQRFEAVRFQPEGAPFARYYDRDGREVEARLRSSPIESYEQVTSLIGDGRGHKGVDFKAPVGTPILAPFDGTVTRRNWSTRGNGRCLEVTDAKTGARAMFLHLSEISVRPGQRVKRGQPIARSGNTGRSTAPHLHYQIERSNSRRIIDPLRFHDTYHRAVPEPQRAGLEARWAEIDARLRPTEG